MWRRIAGKGKGYEIKKTCLPAGREKETKK